MEISTFITIIGVLVALTNIIVQVLKRVTWDKLPTNVVAVIVAVVLTLAAGVAYCQVMGMALTWYLVVGLIVLGFMVAYAAMFGFDKLMEIMKWRDRDE